MWGLLFVCQDFAHAEAFAEVCTGEFGALGAGLDSPKVISGSSTMLF